MSEQKIPIPARLYNAAVGGHICGTEDIIDDIKNKTQKQINSEVEDVLGTGGSVDSRIASAVATETSRAQAEEEALQQLYENLTQSDIVVTEDHTQVASPSANIIYREQGTTSYSDWMYYNNTWKKMAEYDNAIDDEPTAGSDNLVKSGGVAGKIINELYDFNHNISLELSTTAAGPFNAHTIYLYIVDVNTIRKINTLTFNNPNNAKVKIVVAQKNGVNYYVKKIYEEITLTSSTTDISNLGIYLEEGEVIGLLTDYANTIYWEANSGKHWCLYMTESSIVEGYNLGEPTNNIISVNFGFEYNIATNKFDEIDSETDNIDAEIDTIKGQLVNSEEKTIPFDTNAINDLGKAFYLYIIDSSYTRKVKKLLFNNPSNSKVKIVVAEMENSDYVVKYISQELTITSATTDITSLGITLSPNQVIGLVANGQTILWVATSGRHTCLYASITNDLNIDDNLGHNTSNIIDVNFGFVYDIQTSIINELEKESKDNITLIQEQSGIANNSIRWLAIGDSFTEIDDKPQFTGNRLSKGYMTRTCEKIPQLSLTNAGHSGQTFHSALDFTDIVAGYDVYTILFGANDWGFASEDLGTVSDFTNRTAGTILGYFGMLYQKVYNLANGAPIIVMTPMERGVYMGVTDTSISPDAHDTDTPNSRGLYMRVLAEKIKECCETENIPCVNTHDLTHITPKNAMKFARITEGGQTTDYRYPNIASHIQYGVQLSQNIYPTEAIWCLYDGLHPSDLGMELISRELTKTMKKILFS